MPPKVRRVGAYAKLLATYASDDAIIEAGEAAELLFVRGLAFCSTSDADGYITDAQVVRYVGAGMRDALKRAAKLAEVGVWERADGGYVVRSWTKIHDTAEEKGRRRRADRERKTKTEDSETSSVGIPGGIRADGALESLSLIHDTTETQQPHDTTGHVDGFLGGNRPETSIAASVTHPPYCTEHGVDNANAKCHGCRRYREWLEQQAVRDMKSVRDAIHDCSDCDEDGWAYGPDGYTVTAARCALHPNYGPRRSA